MSVRTAGERINLSLNITHLREKKGWSKRELARRIGTHHPVIIRWEQPVAPITIDSVEKLADVFGVSICDLFSPPRANYTPTIINYVQFELSRERN